MAKPITIDNRGRICKGCGIFKVWECFDKKSDGLNGRHSQCKSCVKKFKLKWWRKKSIRKRVNPTVLEFSKSDIIETFIPLNSQEKVELEKILRSMVINCLCSKKGGY